MSCYASKWLKPLAQRDVYEIRKVNGPDIFILANGGITNWRDAVEMIMCGGNLIGVCSETLISGFDIVRPMIQGLKDFMDEHGYHGLGDFRSEIVSEVKTATELTLYSGYAHIIEPNLSAPCKIACPHHVPVQAYVQKVAKGEFRDAFDLITGRIPCRIFADWFARIHARMSVRAVSMVDPSKSAISNASFWSMVAPRAGLKAVKFSNPTGIKLLWSVPDLRGLWCSNLAQSRLYGDHL